MKKVAVLFSGAKDSTFAIYKALAMGYDVKYLITFIPDNAHSDFFHEPNIKWTELQAKAIGIPLIKKEIPENVKKEDAMKMAVKSLETEIDGIVSGIIEDREKRMVMDRVCKTLGIEFISPHWQRSMRQYLEEMIFLGFDVIITYVANEGFEQNWLGRRLDLDAIKELQSLSEKHGIHKGGEAGEYKSFVLDGPIFTRRLKILKARKEWNGVRGVYIIDDAELVDKD
ncbi:MAG: diphthine--ammonia ligase [Candidatus Aenigmarchaeota archaeon]|nr:diphthine--ammonia ligase [Candidatus Aenigmarchaeota archaeon]